jgi:hypothetical protein
MAEVLGALFHWSPRDRRRNILREGLRPYERPVCHTGELSHPYVCFGPTPSAAWSLSGDTLEDDFGGWDLWQVRLTDGDSVSVPQMWGGEIREVRVRNAIAAERLWYVATRMPPSAEEARA